MPSLASWLNERSLRPPMSVTRPTLMSSPSGAAVVAAPVSPAAAVEAAVPVSELSSEPHPAATTASEATNAKGAIARERRDDSNRLPPCVERAEGQAAYWTQATPETLAS